MKPGLFRPIGVVVALATTLLLLLTLLPAGVTTAPVSAQGDTARLRAVHAVPDIAGSPVDVYVGESPFTNDEKVATFDFFNATPYLEVPAGVDLDVAVVLEGDDPNTEAVIAATVNLSAAQFYSAVARGTAATDAFDLGATPLEDDNSTPPTGSANVRVAHFSPGAPNVDVLVNGSEVITDLAYLETSPYLPLASGSYTVEVAPTGGSPIYTDTVTVAAGQVVTAWATGLIGTGVPTEQAFEVRPTVDAEYAYLRAVHAVPDIAGSPVDVYVNGAEVATDFDFFDATDYLPVPAGATDIRVVSPSGGDPDADAVISATVTLEAGKDYSAVARGTAATGDTAELGATLLEDDNTAPPAGQARIRAAHFSPDAPAVDVFVNGTREIEGLSYLSDSDYLTLPAGTNTFAIAPAGGSPIYTTTATLAAGQVVTAWANGLLLGSGAQAFKVTPTIDRETGARVRILHASPNAPAVDVLVDGAVALSGLEFGSITDYLPFVAGTYEVAIRATGTANIVFTTTLTVEAGKDYTVAAIGLLSTGLAQSNTFTLKALVDDNTRPAKGSQAKLRFVHLSPDAPAVDLRVGTTVLFDDVTYPNATNYIDVDAGTVEAAVTTADGSQTVLTETVSLAPSSVNTVFAIGLVDSGAPEDQRLRALVVTDVQAVRVFYMPIVAR